MPKRIMLAKVALEGYCCMNGYLGLCEARGEKRREMADWLDVNPKTLDHHYQQRAKGKTVCMGYSSCMKPLIEELKQS